MSESNPFSAVVAAIPLEDEFLDKKGDEVENVWDVILNVGATDGVELGQNFVVFALGPEVKDPITQKSLGHFEVVRGRGRVYHVQERICTLRSANVKLVPRYNQNALMALTGDTRQEMRQDPIPFDLVAVGDFARRV